MPKQKPFVLSKDDLSYQDPIDELSFDDYIPPSNNSLATFNFSSSKQDNNTPPTNDTSLKIETKPISTNLTTLDIFDNRTTPIANGSAPSINGENPTLKRTYILRKSSVRKINELKAINTDPTTCVSTIVDTAIEYYYNSIKEKN